jgi:hypothetical protein
VDVVAGSFDNSIYIFSAEFGNVVQQVCRYVPEKYMDFDDCTRKIDGH